MVYGSIHPHFSHFSITNYPSLPPARHAERLSQSKFPLSCIHPPSLCRSLAMQSFTTSAIPTPFQPHREGKDHSESRAAVSESESRGDQGLPILYCMAAGAFGGAVGDTTMHSLDTVKTRQQGLLYDAKYRRMIPAYMTILKEEGLFRGLYGGYSLAILGSIPSTAAFFGTYEYSKRKMIQSGVNDTVAYFVAGILGDLALSVFYVPLEVLKTRLQLQGRYNNPYTKGCGYNYRGLGDAVTSIARTEGWSALAYGYKETLFRDLPFSALQFAFYERFRQWAISYNGSDNLPLPLELFTGAAAGGLAGTLTTPLDVIKTRIQTATVDTAGSHGHVTRLPTTLIGQFAHRWSTLGALHSIYSHEGLVGVFSGVGPRLIWTGVQSSIMLLLYQVALKRLAATFGDPRGQAFL